MNIEDFLRNFKAVRNRGKYWMAQCPGHSDHVGSLSIAQKGDKIVLKCHAGCQFADIMDAIGLEPGELFSAAPKLKGVVESYIYTDPRFTPIVKKTRFDEPEGKTFRLFTYDVEEGKWTTGTDPNTLKGLLYRLPDIQKARNAGMPVYLNGGEKACNRLFKDGLCATCAPAGEGTPLSHIQAELLRGCNVIIVADNDKVGVTCAQERYQSLQGIANNCVIVQSRTSGEHDDAYDHLEAGYGISELVPRPDLVPRRGFQISKASSFITEEAKFLWNPYFPQGKLMMIDAKTSTGKTVFALGVFAAFSNGIRPNSHERLPPVKSILFATEDRPGELKAVYEACGGKADHLAIFPTLIDLNDANCKLLKESVLDFGAQVFAFDPIAYYMNVKNLNDAKEVQQYMSRLAKVADETGATGVLIRHVGKGAQERDVDEMGMGSAAFSAAARRILVLRSHPDKWNHKDEVVVTDAKGSLLSRKGQSFGYVREGNQVFFTQPYETDPFGEDGAKAWETAKKFLKERLEKRSGFKEDILTDGLELGIKEHNIMKAVKWIGVKSEGHGEKERWFIPTE